MLNIKANNKKENTAKAKNIIKCSNPRCITTSERNISQSFYVIDETKGEYRCEYCDHIHTL